MGLEEATVRIFLHQAEDLPLCLIEAGDGGFQNVLARLLSGAGVQVDLFGGLHRDEFTVDPTGLGPQLVGRLGLAVVLTAQPELQILLAVLRLQESPESCQPAFMADEVFQGLRPPLHLLGIDPWAQHSPVLVSE